MLNENDIIEAMCDHLKQEGYEIRSRCSTTEKGIDIVAFNDERNETLNIEAKGATSSRIGSSRYGLSFTSSQIKIHVAEAVTFCMKIQNNKLADSTSITGIVLPDNELHHKYVDEIKLSLKRLNIRMYWVKTDKSVYREF